MGLPDPRHWPLVTLYMNVEVWLFICIRVLSCKEMLCKISWMHSTRINTEEESDRSTTQKGI